ncbi:MAG: hypothetical protein V3V12_06400 [Gammaproteobacteria bacterium]
MSNEVVYWPLMMGWLVVCILLVLGLKRQALLAAAGMSIVTYAVVRVAMDIGKPGLG